MNAGRSRAMGGRRRNRRSAQEDVRLAIDLHRRGRLDEAERRYRSVLGREPENPDALHFLGLLVCRRGDFAAGVELVRRATVLAPGYADAFNNLGNLLKVAGKFEDADSAYRRAIALKPDNADAYSNLGVVLKARGKLDEAEQALRTALRLDDRHVIAYTNLGHVLTRLGRREEAIGYYRAAIVFDPGNPEAPKVLGLAYQASGQIEDAREVFRRWLAHDPENPVAAHLLKACSDGEVPERASDAFVRTTFDDMADGFDEHLAELDYQAPRLVAEAFRGAWPEPRGELDVLDAGCGTGLCGAFLRPYARALEGVDLSSGMLRRAQGLGLYDRLFEEELTAFLESQHGSYDAIVSADTLCYFGALDRLFGAAAQALHSGGLLVFTVEKELGAGETGYRLQPHGRYCHAQEYVASQLQRAGLSVSSIVADTLRRESGQDVAGLVVTAGKS